MTSELQVVPYDPTFRADIRRLCCETGFLGRPIDPVFSDRELFADFLTSYYTDREGASAFVLLKSGQPAGYVLGGSANMAHFYWLLSMGPRLVLKCLLRYPRYNPASKSYIRWLISRGPKETPPAPKGIPHFHINLLPQARTVAGTRALIDRYLAHLVSLGEKAVYGQMVTFSDRRGEAMFKRYGFEVVNRSEITKYRALHPEPVYLTTVLKDLTQNSQLYARRDDS